MDILDKWLFNNNELECNPNRLNKISERDEMKLRYSSASFIQDLGELLQVDQLSINTGIVFMHRFYTMQSFIKFPYQTMASACLMVSARILYQYQKVESVAKRACQLTRKKVPNSEDIKELMEDIVIDEEILLSTLGFDTSVDLPHSFVVKACKSDSVPKEIAHCAYLIANASLFTTTMCIKYSPTTVACACILTAKMWTKTEKPVFNDEPHWYEKIDKNLTQEKLQELSNELMLSLTTYPTKFVKKPGKAVTNAEAVNKSHPGMALSNKVLPRTNSQRRPNTSNTLTLEHQNGSLSHKNCDAKSVGLLNGMELPSMKHAAHATNSGTFHKVKDDPFYKMNQSKARVEVLPVQSGFALPMPPVEIKQENKRQLPGLIQPGMHNLNVSSQLLPSGISHTNKTSPKPVNSIMQTNPALGKPSQTITNPNNDKFVIARDQIPQPEVQPFPVSLHSDPTANIDNARDKSKKKHKKDRSSQSEKKQKKKSKHDEDPKEDTRRIAPIRIRLPPLAQAQHCNPMIVESEESSNQTMPSSNLSSDSNKERLKVIINKDLQGNFCHQTPHIIQKHQNIHDPDVVRKRKHEDSRSPSKRPRQSDDHINATSMFPPLKSDTASSLMPSKV